MTLQAAVDANVLISALLAPESNSPPSTLLRRGVARDFTLVVSETTIAEVLDKTEHKPFLAPDDLGAFDPRKALGEPGVFPYTRGIHRTMYRHRLWTMRQFAGFGAAADTNRRFKYLLEHGQTGLSVAFDLPTQMGYDSDAEVAAGEVGKVGVAIDSLADMRRLFDGIPLDQVSTSMTINAPASVLLLLYQLVGEEQGVDPAKLRGTIQNDVLKEYIARGTYIFPPAPSLRIITDTLVPFGSLAFSMKAKGSKYSASPQSMLPIPGATWAFARRGVVRQARIAPTRATLGRSVGRPEFESPPQKTCLS